MFRITCYDSEGYPITHLTQWDIDQTLVVEDSYITEHHEKPPNFHFCNRYSENALVVETTIDEQGRIVADVPNILLQQGTPIIAYVYIYGIDGAEGYSKSLYTIRLPVRPRAKPDDYMYTETEILTWQRLEERMRKLIQEVADNLDEHMLDKNNPHEVTKAQVGLGNVDNTSDLDKPISNATQAALDVITDNLSNHVNDKENPHEVTKAQVGLGNVPNVTTNDQTPTYTEADVSAPLVSGETLSIAFGKIAKAISDLIGHLANKSNPHSVTKAQVGLGNADNTSDLDKPISTATQTALDKKADLGDDGKVPAAQLPSYVDDVLEFPLVSAFPETGETGKIYVDTTENLTYRWSGTTYVEISQSLALGETSSTAYRGDYGKIAYEHTFNQNNPHNITKEQIGLGNIENVVTNDQVLTYSMSETLVELTSGERLAVAFGKLAKAVHELILHLANKSNPHEVTKEQIGLGNVDNTSDADKPISTAVQTALDKKADLDENGKLLESQLPDLGHGLELGETATTAYYGDKGKIAYDHSQSTHARTDATKTAQSTTNGNILINDIETTVYTHPTGAGNNHIPAGGSEGQILQWSASGVAVWADNAGGGGGGGGNGSIIVAAEAPAGDATTLWIDTASGGVSKYWDGTSWVPTKAVWG